METEPNFDISWDSTLSNSQEPSPNSSPTPIPSIAFNSSSSSTVGRTTAAITPSVIFPAVDIVIYENI